MMRRVVGASAVFSGDNGISAFERAGEVAMSR